MGLGRRRHKTVILKSKSFFKRVILLSVVLNDKVTYTLEVISAGDIK